MKYAVIFYSEHKCERVFSSTTKAEADFKEHTLDEGEIGCIRSTTQTWRRSST